MEITCLSYTFSVMQQFVLTESGQRILPAEEKLRFEGEVSVLRPSNCAEWDQSSWGWGNQKWSVRRTRVDTTERVAVL